MEVKRNDPEPVKPPSTYDIIGLTEREAGAIKALVMRGLSWHAQGREMEDFFHSLYTGIEVPEIHLKFRDEDED